MISKNNQIKEGLKDGKRWTVSLNYYVNHVFKVFALRQSVFEQPVLKGLKI